MLAVLLIACSLGMGAARCGISALRASRAPASGGVEHKLAVVHLSAKSVLLLALAGLVLGLDRQGPDPLIVAIGSVVAGATAVLLVTRGLRSRAQELISPATTISRLLVAESQAETRRLARWAGSVARATVPAGSWGDVRAPRRSGAGPVSIVVAYALFFAMAIALALIEAVVVVSSDAGATNAVIRAAAGFNALFVVSILTLATFGLVVAAGLARVAGALGFPVDIAGSLRGLASYVGYGSLAGAVAAAFAPVTRVLLPGSTHGTLSPAVLLEMPALGAVLGYVCGLAALVLGLGRGARNLLHRHLLAPVMFAGLLVALLGVGLTPELLFHQIVAVDVDPTWVAEGLCTGGLGDARAAELLAVPTQALGAMAQCGEAVILRGDVVVGVVSGVVLAFAVTGLVRGVRARVSQEREVLPGRDGDARAATEG